MDEAVDFQLIEQPREMTIGQLTEAYREVLGSLDENRAEQKLLNQQKSDLAIEVMRRCEAEGIDKLSGNGITLSLRDKAVVKIDGDWQDIVAALTATDHAYLIQRRITASKLQEEMVAGMRLPEGITVETIREISHRRS